MRRTLTGQVIAALSMANRRCAAGLSGLATGDVRDLLEASASGNTDAAIALDVFVAAIRIDGRWYSHVIDPRTARPVDDVASATVVAPDAMYIIDQTPEATATLFACHPPGSTRQRIVVHLALQA